MHKFKDGIEYIHTIDKGQRVFFESTTNTLGIWTDNGDYEDVKEEVITLPGWAVRFISSLIKESQSTAKHNWWNWFN